MALPSFQFHRFSTRLVCLLLGLLAGALGIVYLLIDRANRANAIDHIDQNLRNGALIFHQNLTQRIDFLAGSAKVMSGDAAIKPLLQQEVLDAATLRTTLVSYTHRVKAPVITLFSPDGKMLASTDEVLGEENMRPFRHLIQEATDKDMEQASDYSYLGGKLHILVVVPLYAPFPNIAAWFGLAYPIDQAFAQAIKKTTQLEVTFVSSPKDGAPRVLSTTLSPAMAAQVAHRIGMDDSGTAGITQILTLDHEPYVSLYEKLPLLGEFPVHIALQRSLATEMAPAIQLQNSMLKISLAALAVACLAALWLARGLSEPVQLLARHTRLVAAGDYSQSINLPREDELGQLATAFNQMTAGLAERDRVRNLLGMVVSPEIATQLLKSDLKLGGEEREVTILFCDLRDFTSLSEKMPPTEVLALLNRYLDRMSTIIEQHGGVIDKYIGDAIMALFGAPVAIPDAAARAITAARAMGDALEDLNRQLTAEGRPRLTFGIGINTARVVAGNMGSKTRLNYTVIGDGVNLASRLETQTKEPAHQTLIIVSEATAVAAGVAKNLRFLGSMQVKGKSDSIRTYAVDVLPRPWQERT